MGGRTGTSTPPLVNLDAYHDACGTGFIAERNGDSSRRVVQHALEALQRLTHRGSRGPDNRTGDGSGILTSIPADLFTQFVQDHPFMSIPSDHRLAVAMVFLNDQDGGWFDHLINSKCKEQDILFLGMREVPTNPSVLGSIAKDSCPLIRQYLVACPENAHYDVEQNIYLLRRAIEHDVSARSKSVHICSFSSKTIVYKGLMVAEQLSRFYHDLTNPLYTAKVAIFHERYSTNTVSSWSMAQPFRQLAHNGEINTVKGNRLWMRAREKEIISDYWGEDLETLKPIVAMSGSDSFSLDNALEFIRLTGRTLFHSISMLIPDPYEYGPQGESTVATDFAIYHEQIMEPWDGPAALVYTDGDIVGAKLDRNGLRPLRYTITHDGLVIMASEAGVVDVEPENLVLHHHMKAGEIFGVDLRTGELLNNTTIKKQLYSAQPYSALVDDQKRSIDRGDAEVEFGGAQPFDIHLSDADYIRLGWDQEIVSHLLLPMAKAAKPAIGSMGDDTPSTLLSNRQPRFYDYFKHTFAQVTNPPIDPLRESYVTSLIVQLGVETNLLADRPEFARAVMLNGPVLSFNEVDALLHGEAAVAHAHLSILLPDDELPGEALDRLCDQSATAVDNGAALIVLSDIPEADGVATPLPMALVVSAIHQHFIELGIRSKISLICLSGDLVTEHDLAVLVTLGASAVYPYAAYHRIGTETDLPDKSEYFNNYRSALEMGLLKIMAKSGISTLASYHGSMMLHVLGLNQRFLDDYFPGLVSPLSGVDLDHVIAAKSESRPETNSPLPDQGRFRYRRDGESHGFAPSVFKFIQQSTSSQDVHKMMPSQRPIYIRDLLAFRPIGHIVLDDIEEAEKVIKRFGSGAISFGAISEESHRQLAAGFNSVGARSSSGEGGEQPDRYERNNPGTGESCTIKQVASARFGVTPEYLAAAGEIQIKIAQGAKPGEGGQLPGKKVTFQIAEARSSTPWIPLISPPPHHDIYSIEDLAQLIYDLRQINPRAKISVKLVSQPGIGVIATGVSKAGANIIVISGGDGGTGAGPLTSQRHAGFPWEIGLAEVHQTLIASGIRDHVVLRIDGGIRVGRDILMAAALGAEEYDIGTSALIALGCVMARQCHLNTCPAGIATQDETLRKRLKGSADDVADFLRWLAEDVRIGLSEIGLHAVSDLIGRADLLRENPEHEALLKENGIDLSPLLAYQPLDGQRSYRIKAKPVDVYETEHMDIGITRELLPLLMTHGQGVVRRSISNSDRAVGTRLSGEIAYLFGKGKFKGNLQLRMGGVAGQSFGAFLVDGLEMRLRGAANDYVGKGMAGGLITIRQDKQTRKVDHEQTLLGNVALYGATGGTLLVAGRAGERFAVRNSGATAVVEGIGNNGCEYMTRGTVVVLGSVGRNFGAGMTGGLAYLYDPDGSNRQMLNDEYVRTESLLEADEELIRRLLKNHTFHTGSLLTKAIMKNWSREIEAMVKIVPKVLESMDFQNLYTQQVARRRGVPITDGE